jgi:hypothetical protein
MSSSWLRAVAWGLLSACKASSTDGDGELDVKPGKYIVTSASLGDEVDETFTLSETADGIALASAFSLFDADITDLSGPGSNGEYFGSAGSAYSCGCEGSPDVSDCCYAYSEETVIALSATSIEVNQCTAVTMAGACLEIAPCTGAPVQSCNSGDTGVMTTSIVGGFAITQP